MKLKELKQILEKIKKVKYTDTTARIVSTVFGVLSFIVLLMSPPSLLLLLAIPSIIGVGLIVGVLCFALMQDLNLIEEDKND